MVDFLSEKKLVLAELGKPDASRKGNVDEQIMPLLDAINVLEHHYTTSSCAGRFLIIGLSATRKKQDAQWLYVSHETINPDNFIVPHNFSQDIDEVWFKCEAPILHVCSSSVLDALWLLQIARSVGLKRSGIISIKPDRVISEIIGTTTFSFPLFLNGQIIPIDSIFREMMCQKAKDMLAQSRVQFDVFKQELQKHVRS